MRYDVRAIAKTRSDGRARSERVGDEHAFAPIGVHTEPPSHNASFRVKPRKVMARARATARALKLSDD